MNTGKRDADRAAWFRATRDASAGWVAECQKKRSLGRARTFRVLVEALFREREQVPYHVVEVGESLGVSEGPTNRFLGDAEAIGLLRREAVRGAAGKQVRLGSRGKELLQECTADLFKALSREFDWAGVLDKSPTDDDVVDHMASVMSAADYWRDQIEGYDALDKDGQGWWVINELFRRYARKQPTAMQHIGRAVKPRPASPRKVRDIVQDLEAAGLIRPRPENPTKKDSIELSGHGLEVARTVADLGLEATRELCEKVENRAA